MHTERPHRVNVAVAPGFVWDETVGAELDDLDYYAWIPDYDLPSTLVVNLAKGQYKIPQASGHMFTVLYNDQSKTFPVRSAYWSIWNQLTNSFSYTLAETRCIMRWRRT